jgi:hypothetical protein
MDVHIPHKIITTMKSYVLVFIIVLLPLCSCKKKCDGGCGTNYVCSSGHCQCKQWYEGANCDTPMSQKFVGTFAGTLYANGMNPKPDTLVFSNINIGRLLPNYAFTPSFATTNGNLASAQLDSILGGIELISATQGNCFIQNASQNFDDNINCGVCQINAEGTIISLSYSPLIVSPIPAMNQPLDSTVIYTFTGVKM